MRRLHTRYIDAAKLFSRRKGSIFAASSSFYVILCAVPLTLLSLRMLGIILGDIGRGGDEVFLLAEALAPNAAPELLGQFKKILSGPLLEGGVFTWVNSFILLITGINLFGSIWNGLYLITDDKGHTSRWKYLQGLGIIAVSILFLTVLMVLPPLFMEIVRVIRTSFLSYYFEQNLEAGKSVILWMKSIELEHLMFLKSNFFVGILILGYFTCLYRWFFRFKITWKESFIGSFTFVFLLLVAKNVFWIYLTSARDTLVMSYGDYYTFILAFVWVFLVMCFFFFGACLCFEFQKDPLERVLPVEKEVKKVHNQFHD